MKRLVIHGQAEAGDSISAPADFPSGVSQLVRLKRRVSLQRARAGRPPVVIDDLSPDDLVQLELEEGLKLWVRADDVERDFGLQPTRGAAEDEIELPQVLPIGTPSRGMVGNWVIKGLKIFGLDAVGATTDLIKTKVEGILTPGPGLYRLSGQGPHGYTRVKSLEKESTQTPWLVLIHGTASSTDGSFSGLWDDGSAPRMATLLKQYPQRVLAFQHRTLSVSPLANALELAQCFPKGARLHLISHSRGGLVGELLCRSMMEGRMPFDEDDLNAFAHPTLKEDRQRLTELGQVLQQKQLVVERFVRVGCPARGTTLASGRLDRYLSVVLNVVDAIPGLKGNPVVDGLSALLLGVVKNRTNPIDLPGLAAQMPDSPLVWVLNRQGRRTMADLHIVGGDVAGEGLVGRLKTFVTDLFYREDHDLVVNTSAMFGGTERLGTVRYWIDTGKHVDHFHYFRNPETADRLLDALKEQEPETSFHVLERRQAEVTGSTAYQKRALQLDRPVVYVLPGTMGSHLKVGDDRVWLDKWDLAMGGLKKLKVTAADVRPEKPIGSGYHALMEYLSQSHQVIPFAYDWRLSLTESAAALRKSLEETLEALPSEQAVRIVAHSMGGLVVRMMIATEEGRQVWDRLCQRAGARFIMLGTPNGGSHAITAMLMGRDPLVRMLDLLDVRNSQSTLLEIISRFDGVLQLLPHRGTLDVFSPEAWQQLRTYDHQDDRGMFFAKVASSQSAGIYWPSPDAGQLAKAQDVIKTIQGSPIDPARMIYVAGRAGATPDDIRLDPSGKRDRRILVHTTPEGDGRVPWATGIPQALKEKAYYVDCEHGDLANFPEAFEGLADLLQNGVTTKLSKTPSAGRGVLVVPQGGASLSEIYDGRVEMYPEEDDLMAAALGSSRPRQVKPLTPKVKVRVINDNLSRASSPVAVGHYAGDTIVSAEGYLDRQLQGRLRERLRLGLYPDTLNTSAVVLNDGVTSGSAKHPGAIVVGLGMVGELTPGGLTSTMADALTNYALKCVEAERTRRQGSLSGQVEAGRLRVSVTTLLVGTTGGGLTLPDSLQSILHGVLQANRRLAMLEQSDSAESDGKGKAGASFTVFIDSVDVVELYQDRAIQAAKALVDLGQSQDFREHLHIHETLVQGREGQLRAYYAEEQEWWQRLRIMTQEDGALKFEALTNRARAEVYLKPTQRALIERLLARGASSDQTNLDFSSTLFELLIPNRMKTYAPDHRDMVLVLDEESAAYPWELLYDRYDPNTRPMAVEAGMIRQLSVEQSQFREKVLHGTALNALVIGDPTSDTSSQDFPPLPGAAAEARDVATLIRQNGYREVIELVQADAYPEAILGALFQQPYRILHCAAHGVFEYRLDEETSQAAANLSARVQAKQDPCVKPKTVSGMVLGKGLFLTPAEIEQMRYVPELVFLNCCYLGKITAHDHASPVPFHRLASNLGTQLIRMGVRAVIAAGWAVDDQAANVFANTFYTEMFRNRPFGDAVTLARQAIFAQFGNSNTWGAYQCYGDPDYTFKPDPNNVKTDHRMVAPAELVIELASVARQAKTTKGKGEERLRQQLDDLKALTQPEWMESADVCAAFGKAYGELGLFEEAVQYYDKGRRAQPATATIDCLEQLANLKVRWALKQGLALSSSRMTTEDIAKRRSFMEAQINDAETVLDGLLGIHPTQERCALKGKVYKGKALLSHQPGLRSRALRAMHDWYGQGYDVGTKAKRSDTYYPLVNRLAAEIVLSWGLNPTRGAKGKRRKVSGIDTIENGLSELEQHAERLLNEGQSFWDWGLNADVLLLKALYAQTLTADDRDAIFNGYQEAQRREGSAREIDSVVENIRFFEVMLETMHASPAHSTLAESLKMLRDRLVPSKSE